MDKEKEIKEMAKELHCATSESLISCRKIAKILVERCGYGNVKQAVKEFAEKLKEYANALKHGTDESEGFALGFRIVKEVLLEKIDDLITEFYGADDKE